LTIPAARLPPVREPADRRPVGRPAPAPVGWSAGELATLALLAGALVPSEDPAEPERRANLAAAALALAADPSQLRQLRLVIRLFDSRVGCLLLTGRPTRLRDRAPGVREALLRSWAESSIPLRRSAFQALKKLLVFLAYADPGLDGTNPRLVSIGYAPDEPPVTAELTPVRSGLVAFRPGGEPLRLDADVAIVGSGATGGVVASELAGAGRSVVVLEAGPFVDEATMPANELDGFDRLYLNHGLLTSWDSSVTLLAGSTVGGGTTVNWMTSIRPPDEVREEWARDHGIDGWDGVEGDADHDAIEGDLGVTPAVTWGPKDAAILRGAEELGWRAAPIARNTAGCDDCGSCLFGCQRGAKRSGLRAHLADGVRAGARVVADAEVQRLILDGGRTVGVEAIVGGTAARRAEVEGRPVGPWPGATPAPRHLAVTARQVVLAAGALRTPAVLERSGLDHPALGRHLRIHPVPVVAIEVTEPVDPWRGPMQAARCDEFVRSTDDHRGYVIESAPGHPGLVALVLPWVSSADHAERMRRSRNTFGLIAVTRDGGEGRVSLTRAGRVRIDYRLDEDGEATLRHALVSMIRLGRAAGGVETLVVATPPLVLRAADPLDTFLDRVSRLAVGANRGDVFSAHQMGTARAGTGARSHVCDPRGRVRRSGRGDAVVAGLYVADGSLFPTALGVNPMVSIMAMARRVSRTVLAEG
jgi:choline dehydrogenase-like flavoprotein